MEAQAPHTIRFVNATPHRILVAWLGHADLLAMAAEVGDPVRQAVLELTRAKPLPSRGAGPIRTLLANESFRTVHLLSQWHDTLNEAFSRWLGDKVRVHTVDLHNPTDYAEVFHIANGMLDGLKELRANKPAELCIHLSPGTPTMTAIWVLLGKSRFPATFYQSYEGKAWRTDIPFDLAVDYVPRLLREPDRALQNLAMRSPQQVHGFEDIIGESEIMRLIVDRARRSALRDVPVLLLGESGTGKEMFARAIHAASHRRDKPFVAINCGAIPDQLLESEIFGHKRGAFTGATQDRIGAFELAHGGTLFLDEVGESSVAMQVKLLRVLQPLAGRPPTLRTFSRLGESSSRSCDVRVLAATNRDPMQAIQQHTLREDLYYRLATITLHLPPMRDRKEDLAPLAQSLLDRVNHEFARNEPGYVPKSFTPGALALIKRHPWPGNVRQLYNAIVQTAVMADGDWLDEHAVASAVSPAPHGTDDLLEQPLGNGFKIDELLQSVHRHYLERAMQEAEGRVTRAARLLGVTNYQTVDAQLKRFGLTALKGDVG